MADLPSWRGSFKRAWCLFESRDIPLPINPAYRPNVELWRNRTTPFWKHADLVPLAADRSDSEDGDEETPRREESPTPRDPEVPEDEDGERDEVADLEWENDAATFEEEMRHVIADMRHFADGLEHQVQFRDPRMLAIVKKKGAGMLRLMDACFDKEDRLNNTRRQAPRTWENSEAMFYRPVPRVRERNT
uniref:Uncharacterized protein n=1 Tax=Mycena chlorophos TaxID=658473 RepID=A0ABQ0LSL5_MYCCL|nr:predicted protein [Mycena chlorophos]